MRRALILAAVLLCAGCVTEGRARIERIPAPWPEDDPPVELVRLAEDLQAFLATTGRLPEALVDMDRTGIATGGPYAARAYAWHPTGIGLLPEGWRVFAADDRVRKAGEVWCVVRPPARLRSEGLLRVVRVPMPDLRQAAATAGGER